LNAYKTILKLIVPLVIGILLGSYLELHFVIAFTLWSTLFIALLVLHFSAKQVYQLRSLIGYTISLLFLVTGILNYAIHSPRIKTNSIENNYLPNDKLIITLDELSYGTGSFYKSIASVNGIIRGRDTNVVSGRILFFGHKDFGLLETGDQLVIKSELNSIQNKGNPGEFNQEWFWFNHAITQQSFAQSTEIERIGHISTVSGFWGKVRNYLITELKRKVTPEVLGLTTALSLGDKSLLEKETRENFANAGAMHVLAVSGLHVGILLGIIQWLCKFIHFLQRNYRYLIVSIVVIWLYAMLTGMSPSVARAALMFTILAVGKANGKSFFSINSLMTSALLLLLWNPLLLYHIGFQLSYFAMFGISFFYEPIRQLLAIQNKWLRKIWEGTALGIAAQIGTAAISLYYFHQFPNYFILTNIIFIVLAGVALASVLLFFFLHPVPFLSDLIAEGINLIYGAIIWVVTLINKFPYAVAKGFTICLGSLLLFYCLLGFTIYFNKKRHLIAFIAGSISLFLVSNSFIYQRYSNLNKRELIALNHKYPVLLLKYPGGIFCFYDERANGDENSIAFDVDMYHKMSGGELSYFMVSKGNQGSLHTIIKDREITIETNDQFLSLSIDKTSFVLPKRNTKEISSNSDTLIIAGTFSKLYKGHSHHTLHKEGAFRFTF
jgi:competence protein ComEC